jgi:hypothetical protein
MVLQQNQGGPTSCCVTGQPYVRLTRNEKIFCVSYLAAGHRNNGVDIHPSGSNEMAFGAVVGASEISGNWAARGDLRPT